MRLLQLRRVNFVVLGDRPVDAEDYRLGLAWQISDAKGSLPALDTRFRNVNDITHDFVLPEESIRSNSEWLFVPDSLRRSFEVEGNYLQLPFERHRRRRIANRLVAGLVF
jgi:hypothetical protein